MRERSIQHDQQSLLYYTKMGNYTKLKSSFHIVLLIWKLFNNDIIVWHHTYITRYLLCLYESGNLYRCYVY